MYSSRCSQGRKCQDHSGETVLLQIEWDAVPLSVSPRSTNHAGEETFGEKRKRRARLPNVESMGPVLHPRECVRSIYERSSGVVEIWDTGDCGCHGVRANVQLLCSGMALADAYGQNPFRCISGHPCQVLNMVTITSIGDDPE